ncbi:peptidyl-prolyl cis-trans isomerase FKBP16-1, chloroplastic-like isoform X2 [Cucumis melo]|uniref:peptidylprolyl isomerase n=1 Tax=Cucumis melo TaxID=3656 RepID=A0ABM3KLA9_CUCME|nr:peptidyl-prolyl cis-trans isomerase FKBP16-1, chloroplastic-like isoform X2 [Cucumis melo]XP_050938587.1 peptidyl-prolyl cis-trans isomerase FKBP16-1, chloroplastic-like isoform X2 [Cucumis melo]
MDEEVSISKHPMINHLDVRNASFSVKRFPRRLFSHFIGFYPILLYAYPSFGAPMMEMQEPDIVRTLKLDSGVRIQEVFEGDGAEAHEGDMVEFNYVCRRSNGYFVHSTVDQFSGESTPVILPLKEKQVSAARTCNCIFVYIFCFSKGSVTLSLGNLIMNRDRGN